MKINDLTGKTIGCLFVLSRDLITRSQIDRQRTRWFCKCVCGKILSVVSDALNRPKPQQSCGCQSKDNLGKATFKHGGRSNRKFTREYRSWTLAKNRCFNINSDKYHYYGGRGITMCDQWKKSFIQFLYDMGEAPNGYTLDRIDVNGDYTPSNCKWSDRKNQAINRRNTILINCNGYSKTINELCTELGIKYSTAYKWFVTCQLSYNEVKERRNK